MFGFHRSPMRHASPLLFGAIALVCFCIPSLAQAGSSKEPGLLVVQPKGTARERAIAAEAVTAEVTRAGWTLTPRTFAPQETEELAKCLLADRPWACFTKTVRDDAIRRLALISLEPQSTPEGNPMTVVTVMVASVEQQDVAYSGRRFCQACSPDSLAKLTSAAAREVLEKMYLASGRTYLLVKSRPAGASIEVDGKPMGVTDTSFEILPGRHRVVLKHPKHPPQMRWIDAQEDKTAIVTVAFGEVVEPGSKGTPEGPTQPTVPNPDPRKDKIPPTPERALLLPKLVVVAGAALVVGGVAAIALDEDAPAEPPLNEAPAKDYLNTSPLGVGLLISGAVVAGAGAWWWWRSSTKPTNKNLSAAFAVQPGGGAVSFTKLF
jgi:PEGA domain